MSIVEEAPLVQNVDRNFNVGLFRCVVTGCHDKCIRVKLTDLPWTLDGEPQVAEIYGQFSETGLRSLLTDLEAAPPPLTLPTPEAIRQGTAYQWVVRFKNKNCNVIKQFNEDGSENPFSRINCAKVEDFWLVPRDPNAGLPSFCLSRLDGFSRVFVTPDSLGEMESLNLPFPANGEFQFNYFRRNTITFTTIAGENEVWPVHTKSILGWQVGDPENPVIMEIAVENDGSWMEYQRKNIVVDDEGNLAI